MGQALKRYVNSSDIGCTGRKVRCHDIQYYGVHIKRSVLNKDLIAALDEGNGSKTWVFLTTPPADS